MQQILSSIKGETVSTVRILIAITLIGSRKCAKTVDLTVLSVNQEMVAVSVMNTIQMITEIAF